MKARCLWRTFATRIAFCVGLHVPVLSSSYRAHALTGDLASFEFLAQSPSKRHSSTGAREIGAESGSIAALHNKWRKQHHHSPVSQVGVKRISQAHIHPPTNASKTNTHAEGGRRSFPLFLLLRVQQQPPLRPGGPRAHRRLHARRPAQGDPAAGPARRRVRVCLDVGARNWMLCRPVLVYHGLPYYILHGRFNDPWALDLLSHLLRWHPHERIRPKEVGSLRIDPHFAQSSSAGVHALNRNTCTGPRARLLPRAAVRQQARRLRASHPARAGGA